MKLKHSACAVVAISLALCGCVEMQKMGDRTAAAPAGSRRIEVKIEKGTIVVPEDKVVVTADIGAIIWYLPKEGSYIFPRDGIVIDPGNFSPCAPTGEGRRSFMCVKRGHKLGTYKYIVNVSDGTTPLEPLPLPPLDPWVVNH